MPNIASTLSIYEASRLLQRWGFTRERGNGGHDIYIKNDQRVQLPGQGRKAAVTQPMLRKAARICGVTLTSFKQGPPEPIKPKAQVREPSGWVIDDAVIAATAEEPEEIVQTEVLAPPSKTRPWGENSPSLAVWRFMRDHPGEPIRLRDIAKAVNLLEPNVASALRSVMKQYPRVQKLATGVYCYVTEPGPRTEVEPPRKHAPRKKPAAPVAVEPE